MNGEVDLFTDPTSPFDAGRTPCPQGGEDRWSARWLMGELGYESWQKFEGAIERAKSTAHNEGFNVRTLFRLTPKKAGGGVVTGSDKNLGGRPLTDYQVTRYAAYLIAMNGDPRKREVSAAQHYFAVKTREAEVAAPRELSDDEIIHRALTLTVARVEALTAKVAELEPKAEFYDDLMDADGAYSWQATANVLGWGRNVMLKELRRAGVVQGNRLPYARYAHHFKVVPKTYTHPNTGEQILTATTYVLPSGVEFLRKKLSGSEVLA
jgi:DNA-damage-inducible protein D